MSGKSFEGFLDYEKKFINYKIILYVYTSLETNSQKIALSHVVSCLYFRRKSDKIKRRKV